VLRMRPPPNPERIVVSFGAATASASAATRRPELCWQRSAPCVKRCGRRATTGEANSAPNGERKASAGSQAGRSEEGRQHPTKRWGLPRLGPSQWV
jgi:hypothetical protein